MVEFGIPNPEIRVQVLVGLLMRENNMFSYNYDDCLDIANEYLDAYKGKLEAEAALASARDNLKQLERTIIRVLQQGDRISKAMLKVIWDAMDDRLNETYKEIEEAERQIGMFLSELDGLSAQLQNAGCL